MDNFLEKNTGFIGSNKDYEDAFTILVGAPLDLTSSFRSGTREGPRSIRWASWGLEEYSLDLGKDLDDYNYYDAGDIILPPGNLKEGLHRIGSVVEKIFHDKKFPLLLGGEHLISLPVIEKAIDFYPELVVIQLDAHADLRTEYLGQRYSHATVMRLVTEIIGIKNLYQFGIRSGIKEELDFARVNTHMFFYDLVAPIEKLLPAIQGRPVYISLDIDVADPAYAPGTGSAEPGGCSARELLKAVQLLGSLDVVGFDLVEVNPPCDQTGCTALLAAKLVREAILSFSQVRK